MIKKNVQKGFTLVEVIVVAVIVAILAGVSVPLYLGYINNSRVNQATNAAGSAASFVNACHNGGGTITIDEAGAFAASVEVDSLLVCATGNGNDPSLQLPENITLTVSGTGNSFTAENSEGGGESAPFSFTPATTPPPAP